jgi:hypothetical protein
MLQTRQRHQKQRQAWRHTVGKPHQYLAMNPSRTIEPSDSKLTCITPVSCGGMACMRFNSGFILPSSSSALLSSSPPSTISSTNTSSMVPYWCSSGRMIDTMYKTVRDNSTRPQHKHITHNNRSEMVGAVRVLYDRTG